MHKIEPQEASDDFARCWQAAGSHIQRQVQGSISWLKANLTPPFLEHLSFRLGNQLFFVRIEDADERLEVPGSRDGLLAIATGSKGYPCIMPMKTRAGTWTPEAAGWGLIDARTGQAIDPILLVSDELIEMTDWEVHDFAVEIVRRHLTEAGSTMMSSQGNPAVDPSIWFVGANGPEWVVVRAVRYPQTQAEPPANWNQIAAHCSAIGKVGHFASVGVASTDDAFEATVPAVPLWRGHSMIVRFKGLASKPDTDLSSPNQLAALLTFVQSEDRVCPRPMNWQDFWTSLPNAKRTDEGWEPAPPIVLSAWRGASNAAKADRLREHIEWAALHGGLDAADTFLRGLPIEAWHHSNPRKPNY